MRQQRHARSQRREWMRVGADMSNRADVVAIWASAKKVLAVTDDGAVVELLRA